MASERRGTFIVFEGPDHVGKTTQVELLQNFLLEKDEKVIALSFPDRSTPIGTILDSFLKGRLHLAPEAAHLLFSANRWELAVSIKRLLATGFTVIVDRYAYSGIAYSVAKKTVSMEWASQSDIGLPAPDVVLYMLMDTKKLAERQGYGDEIFDKIEFQEAVVSAYSVIRANSYEHWYKVDADDTIENIHQRIRDHVLSIIKHNDHVEKKIKFI